MLLSQKQLPNALDVVYKLVEQGNNNQKKKKNPNKPLNAIYCNRAS